ncbi:MAG: 50S ribosomal protein L25/general stress protein Ctc [Crocinitomix sp.]|nr:50S ribosomal protein L25/general stress protein Ctc [Crocinitomix sp.]
MKEVSLSGSVRSNVGKKDAKAVRVNGDIPCVIYGTGKQIHFSVKHIDMEKLVYTPDVNIISLEIGGTNYRSIIQDIQFHPVTDKIVHIDFIELQENKRVKVSIPLNLFGRSTGVLSGGKLQQIFKRVKVFALPNDIPASIEVDITKLKIGQSIRIKDINTPALNIINAPNAVVCSVKMARGAVANTSQDDLEEEEVEESTEETAEA